MRILIVEDEQKLATTLKKVLLSERFSVDTAADGEEGYERGSGEEYDLIIMDVGLPLMNGVEVCKALRDDGNKTPVLMLTARDSLNDKIAGLDSGADDYLVKPFSIDELMARIRALIRRSTQQTGQELKAGSLVLNTKSHEVFRSKTRINLSAKEYALLEYLMFHQNQIVSKQSLIEHVWGSEVDPFSKVVDVYVGYVRKKVDKNFPTESALIQTVRGMGYKIQAS